MPESMAALERLADIPEYSEVSGFKPSFDTPIDELRHHSEQAEKYHEETVKPWAEHTMSLMEQERIPQHPKLRQQYNKGLLTAQEYARELILSIPHS